MSFASPLNLLALLALPLVAILWALARRRRRAFAVRHPGAAVVAGVASAAPAWRRRAPALLLAVAAAALALAFARPQATVAVPVERASVMLVTDKSGSMLAADVEPTRLAAAQKAARSFMDSAPDSLQVGFISYANAVEGVLEPTLDHSTVTDAIDALSAQGGTATGDALSAALDRLEARRDNGGDTAPAAIVLLSDGKTTDGTDPLEAADRAKKLGVPISTVALGTDQGVVNGPMGEPFGVPPDPATLKAIADRSGGQAFAVDDADQLDKIYEELGSRIGTKQEAKDVGSMFAAGGLVLLLGGLFTGMRRRGALV
jgi:Ca-activated chloride channel family protein